ncbi:MAG: DNA-processing protein DprA [Thermomicrobiales bacterium]
MSQPEGAQFWVAFHLVPYIGSHRVYRLLERFGSLEQAWSAPVPDLRAVLDERSLSSLIQHRQELDPVRELERINRAGIRVLTRNCRDYPRLLAEIPAPPPVLYVKGSLSYEDAVAVSIVGTRKLTSYGLEVTRRLATELADAGVVVVSGLARGIDGIAHEAALKAGGRTIAVLGSGVNVIYPPEHRGLAEQITGAGALLSDYPPDRGPDAPNFPARNRIIAGLTLGTIVVEAPTRSGALITTDFALDYGREVFAVPGSVLSHVSSGCHRLLRHGARLVTCAADVLDDLNLVAPGDAAPVQQSLPLEEDERRLLALLTGEPQHIDEVAEAAGRPIAQVAALLLTMELKGLIHNAGAQHYTRT